MNISDFVTLDRGTLEHSKELYSSSTVVRLYS